MLSDLLEMGLVVNAGQIRGTNPTPEADLIPGVVGLITRVKDPIILPIDPSRIVLRGQTMKDLGIIDPALGTNLRLGIDRNPDLGTETDQNRGIDQHPGINPLLGTKRRTEATDRLIRGINLRTEATDRLLPGIDLLPISLTTTTETDPGTDLWTDLTTDRRGRTAIEIAHRVDGTIGRTTGNLQLDPLTTVMDTTTVMDITMDTDTTIATDTTTTDTTSKMIDYRWIGIQVIPEQAPLLILEMDHRRNQVQDGDFMTIKWFYLLF